MDNVSLILFNVQKLIGSSILWSQSEEICVYGEQCLLLIILRRISLACLPEKDFVPIGNFQVEGRKEEYTCERNFRGPEKSDSAPMPSIRIQPVLRHVTLCHRDSDSKGSHQSYFPTKAMFLGTKSLRSNPPFSFVVQPRSRATKWSLNLFSAPQQRNSLMILSILLATPLGILKRERY